MCTLDFVPFICSNKIDKNAWFEAGSVSMKSFLSLQVFINLIFSETTAMHKHKNDITNLIKRPGRV